MIHSIQPPMAHWSSNSLRPETCDLRPNPFWLRIPSIVAAVDARRLPIAATGGHSSAPTMDDASGVIGGGR